MDKNEATIEHGIQALHDIKDTLKAGGADVTAEVHGAADDILNLAADGADLAREAGNRVGGHARAATGSVKVALTDAVESAGEAARDFVDYQRSNLRDWKIRTNEFIKAKPVISFAAAGAAGFLISLWLRKPKR